MSARTQFGGTFVIIYEDDNVEHVLFIAGVNGNSAQRRKVVRLWKKTGYRVARYIKDYKMRNPYNLKNNY